MRIPLARGGLPHLIRCTYYPNWQAKRGADRVYLATPAFMLVYPREARVELVYGSTAADRAGRWLTAGGAVLSAAAFLTLRRTRRKEAG